MGVFPPLLDYPTYVYVAQVSTLIQEFAQIPIEIELGDLIRSHEFEIGYLLCIARIQDHLFPLTLGEMNLEINIAIDVVTLFAFF